MSTTIVAQATEYLEIHLSICRYRAQNLRCSTCSDLTERAEKLARRFAAQFAVAA